MFEVKTTAGQRLDEWPTFELAKLSADLWAHKIGTDVLVKNRRGGYVEYVGHWYQEDTCTR